MALRLASPCGLLSDEDEGGAAVFESTAADVGGLMGARFRAAAMPEISLISPSLEPQTPQRGVRTGRTSPRRGPTMSESSRHSLLCRTWSLDSEHYDSEHIHDGWSF